MNEVGFILTKSQFKRYRECPVALWLELFRPDWLGEPSATARQAMMNGDEVDAAARGLYPDGRLVTDAGGTAAALRHEEVVFQPTIAAPDERWLCRPDILRRSAAGAWDILEVKATKRVKDEHLTDIGFQAACLGAVGLTVDRLKIVCLNGDYVRHGDIVPEELFTLHDVTRQVRERLPALKDEMRAAVAEVALWRGTERIETVLRHCPHGGECEAATVLVNGGPVGKTAAQGRPELGEVTDERKLRYLLRQLTYPLHYFDYETYLPAVPWYDGYRPYEPVPFQFSLDIELTPGGAVEHHEFLAKLDADPTPELMATLRRATRAEGNFVAWFSPFEKMRNEDMIRRAPEHLTFLRDVNARMFDLMIPFKRRGGAVTHPDFHGSASLKSVVPALLGDRYGELEIREGGMAMAAWPELIGHRPFSARPGDLERAMLDYCNLDTRVMVDIMAWLRSRVPNW